MSILPTDNLRAPSRLGRLGIFLAGFVTAVFLLFLVSYPAGRGRWLQRVLHVDLDQPAIVQRIQRLQRLESVKYTLEKVVTGERQSRFLPQSQAGERLLLIVRGEVFAGVDLGIARASRSQSGIRGSRRSRTPAPAGRFDRWHPEQCFDQCPRDGYGFGPSSWLYRCRGELNVNLLISIFLDPFVCLFDRCPLT